MSEAQSLPGPLASLRVLELADETGQFCGKLLGDLGADVVKIEPQGGVMQERARLLAAVPVSTGKATSSGFSKISRKRRSTLCVHSSAP